jgi:hypothetical protein
VLLVVGCSEKEPPGAEPASSGAVVIAAEDPSDGGAVQIAPKVAPGSADDNLPFEPTGDRIASIAWRTWVYTDTGPKRTRYGYLRAGAIVERRGPEIKNDGCSGGWRRINPRGFVCVGKGATLDLNDPVVVASSRRPIRGDALPYGYALARERPPHLYFRLPSVTDMGRVEGPGALTQGVEWRARAASDGLFDALGEPHPPPEFVLEAKALPKPYGVKKRLHYSVHAGLASSDSGFSLSDVYAWQGRAFALTAELDLVALDRTKPVRPSAFHGVALGEGEDLPAAIVTKRWAIKYEKRENGQLAAVGTFEYREALKLTGDTHDWEGAQPVQQEPQGAEAQHAQPVRQGGQAVAGDRGDAAVEQGPALDGGGVHVAVRGAGQVLGGQPVAHRPAVVLRHLEHRWPQRRHADDVRPDQPHAHRPPPTS